jgi:hypothetical protein
VSQYHSVPRLPHFAAALLMLCIAGNLTADERPSADIEKQRLDLMRQRTQAMAFRPQRGDPAAFPSRLESEPLFRYDDLTRGYVDGTLWRLGAEGRPLAIVTAELSPNYQSSGPKVVYDFLSLSDVPFVAGIPDVPYTWSPPRSAVAMAVLPGAAEPAATPVRRLFQMKQLAGRFTATQDVTGEEIQRLDLNLRLLPNPIDRYTPGDADRADGTIFMFASGRMPGVVLVLETDGTIWKYGIGRLSQPSTLIVHLDGAEVWKQPPAGLGTNQPYTATNGRATIPGVE